MEPLTWMSMVGAGLYIIASLACLTASWITQKFEINNNKSTQWFAIGALFFVLVLARLLQWEELARLWLEAEFLVSQDYAQRRLWQGPSVAVIAAIAFLCSWLAASRWRKNKNKSLRSFYLAQISAIAMLCLIALRVISFHATDQLLYGMRLNWVIDPALTLAVAGAAIWTVRRGSAPPS